MHGMQLGSLLGFLKGIYKGFCRVSIRASTRVSIVNNMGSSLHVWPLLGSFAMRVPHYIGDLKRILV